MISVPFAFLFVDEVNIGVVGDGNVGMTKQFADGLDILPGGEQTTCKCVT